MARSGQGWIDPTRAMMAAGRIALSNDGPTDPPPRSAIILEDRTPPVRSSPPDERAVVQAVLDGDREAFRRLVEQEGAAVVRACQRILGDLPSAEDAAQEAFVTAYRSLATWRGDGPFGAWLARIAVRIALREAARRRPVAWTSASDVDVATPADRAADRDAVAAVHAHDPASLSVQAERATEVRRAVIGLPEPYREVVALRFFADASLDEIARQTGRPLGTVKTHLHRGLARLRGELHQEGPR